MVPSRYPLFARSYRELGVWLCQARWRNGQFVCLFVAMLPLLCEMLHWYTLVPCSWRLWWTLASQGRAIFWTLFWRFALALVPVHLQHTTPLTACLWLYCCCYIGAMVLGARTAVWRLGFTTNVDGCVSRRQTPISVPFTRVFAASVRVLCVVRMI